jgi:hypothetical protein
MLDRHFRMTAADGAVYDVEHLLNVSLKNDNLAAFVATWDSVVAGIDKTPEDSFLCSLLLRELRRSNAFSEEISYYDRLASDHPDKNYAYLMRRLRSHIELKRLNWYREEMTKSLTGGIASPAGKDGKGKGKGGKDGKGKGKGKSKDKSGASGGDSRHRTSSTDKKDVCRNYLNGKCKAGESCTRYHPPPCRFFRGKGGCRQGKDCFLPHVNPRQPSTTGAGAAATTADGKKG